MTDFTKTIPAHEENSEMSLLISVAICTYNRADRLVLALEALCCQSLPVEYFEILVVDNASTDNTQEICTRYQQQLPNLRYIYEPVQGLGYARNTAIKQAYGKYLSYLDDDAIPCAVWLETILNTFQTVQPTPVSVGGPLYPLWESPKSDWIPKEAEYLFSLLDLGDQPQWLRLPKYPYGANMTFDREVLRQAGGFSHELGRQGHKVLLSSEEYMVYRSLIDQGRGLLYYDPQASVQHWVSKERMNLKWMLSRSYWQGRTTAVVARLLGKSLEQEWLDILRGLRHGKPLTQVWSLLKTWSDAKAKALAQIKFMQSWGYLMQVWLRTFGQKSPLTSENKPSASGASTLHYQQQKV